MVQNRSPGAIFIVFYEKPTVPRQNKRSFPSSTTKPISDLIINLTPATAHSHRKWTQNQIGCIPSCGDKQSPPSIENMVYHSTFIDEEGIVKACGCPLLPLKSHIRGPAPVSDQATTDIIDEAITFFRANVFFKNFDIQSPADKLLVYLTFYINVALKRLEGCRTLAEGTKAVINLGLEDVPVPGESGFPFPGLFPFPPSQEEAELLRNYLKQIREETSGRLLSVAYRPNGTPNKWWLAFAKRKFINTIAL
ncbi:unnamed protein product [Lactuca virosa]|uniref:Actin-related protein 2/3 complex subunit 3 n=1 Tax=Lactuca virosa TaxID=75947 RepID=A0AAU9M1D5_9ASTR|nr:unnamed protein product [Lactuca virosa]